MENRKFETEMKLMILYHMTYPLEVKGQGVQDKPKVQM